MKYKCLRFHLDYNKIHILKPTGRQEFLYLGIRDKASSGRDGPRPNDDRGGPSRGGDVPYTDPMP